VVLVGKDHILAPFSYIRVNTVFARKPIYRKGGYTLPLYRFLRHRRNNWASRRNFKQISPDKDYFIFILFFLHSSRRELKASFLPSFLPRGDPPSHPKRGILDVLAWGSMIPILPADALVPYFYELRTWHSHISTRLRNKSHENRDMLGTSNVATKGFDHKWSKDWECAFSNWGVII